MTLVATAIKSGPVRRKPAWAARTPPRPIRSRVAHRAALDELMRLGRLIDARKASKAQSETAEVLKLLVIDYERRRFGEIPQGGTPVERLRWLMEEHAMGIADLGLLLGDRGLGSRILSGQRELSKTHIRRLAERFHINPGFFL